MERHRFDPISFVFGMLLATVGLIFLFGDVDIGELDASWIWPLPLIAVGVAMLFAARRRETGGRDAWPDNPARDAGALGADDRIESASASGPDEPPPPGRVNPTGP